jgi:hypothetical protein
MGAPVSVGGNRDPKLLVVETNKVSHHPMATNRFMISYLH